MTMRWPIPAAAAERLRLLDLPIVAGLFVVLAGLLSPQRVTDFIIFCVFVLSYDLLYGHLGRLSFGHMLYLGTGAYTAALSAPWLGGNPLLVLAASAAAGALAGLAFGPIAVRANGASFALINLAFNQVGHFVVLIALADWTGGEDGLSVTFRALGPLDLNGRRTLFAFCLAALLASIWLMRRLTASPFGILLRSIKQNETRVQFLGYDVYVAKLQAFVASASLAAFAGGLAIVNFAHALVYTLGAYVLYTVHGASGGWFVLAAIAGVVAVVPVAWLIERYVIRRLYGQSIDYAIIGTYAVLLIGVDGTKWIWGASPIPLSDPIGAHVTLLGVGLPVYRLVIIAISLVLFAALEVFFRRTVVGKIIVAGLEDKDAVRSLGIRIDSYFSLVFVLGSALAALGGILYAPITTVHPYMGFHVLLLSFAVVLVGGLGSMRGTLLASFGLGMVIAVTGRLWGPAAETMVFVVMAAVLVVRPLDV